MSETQPRATGRGNGYQQGKVMSTEPSDIAVAAANDPYSHQCVPEIRAARIQRAIDEATAELREQARLGWERHAQKDSAYGDALMELDAQRIRIMELERSLDAMHARVEKAEEGRAEIRDAVVHLEKWLDRPSVKASCDDWNELKRLIGKLHEH